MTTSSVSETHSDADLGVWIVEEEHLDVTGAPARTYYGSFPTLEAAGVWMDTQPDDEDRLEMRAVFVNHVVTPPAYALVADTGYYGNFSEDVQVIGPFGHPETAHRAMDALYPGDELIKVAVVRVGEVPSDDELAALRDDAH